MPNMPIAFGGYDGDGKAGQLGARTNNSYKMAVNLKGGIESQLGVAQVRDLINAIPTNNCFAYSEYSYNQSSLAFNLQSNSTTFAGTQDPILLSNDSNFIYLTTAYSILKINKVNYSVIASYSPPLFTLAINQFAIDNNWIYFTWVSSMGYISLSRLSLADFVTRQDYPSNLGAFTTGMGLDANYLYFGLVGGTIIYTLSLTDFATLTTFITITGPNPIVVNSQYVYNLNGTTLTRISKITLGTTNKILSITPSFWFIDNTYFYFSDESTRSVIRLYLADFNTINTFTLPVNQSGYGLYSDNANYLYVSSVGTAKQLVRISLSDFSTSSTITVPAAIAYMTGDAVNLYCPQVLSNPTVLNVVSILNPYKLLASVKNTSNNNFYIYDVTTPGSETSLLQTTNYYNDINSSFLNGILFITGGDNELPIFMYNGTTGSTFGVGAGGAVNVSYQCVHLGRVFYITKSGQLYWSNIADGTTVQLLNTDAIGPNDGDSVARIESKDGILFVFKYHNVYAITGNSFDNVNGVSNYVITQIKVPGLYSNQSMCIKDDYFYYGSKDKGFVLFDGSNFQTIHQNIDPKYWVNTETYGPMLTNDKDIIMPNGRFDTYTGEYCLTKYSYVNFGFRYVSANTNRYSNYFLVQNRYIYQLDYSLNGNNEINIDQYFTDWMAFGDSSVWKNFTALYLNLEKQGNYNLNIDIFTDFNTTAKNTLTYNLAAIPANKYVLVPLGYQGWFIRFRFYTTAINQPFVINSATIDIDAPFSGKAQV